MDRRRFDAYEINLTTGELTRDGQPVALQRQPARVLARLVARAGTLVPRADLQAAVWGPDVHVDFDRGLNYRFIAPVSLVRAGEAADSTSAVMPRVSVRRDLARLTIAAAFVAAAVLALVTDIAAGPSPDHHRIAVAVARAVHDAIVT